MEAKDYIPPLSAFYRQMVREMEANTYKNSWRGLGVEWALDDLHYHVSKLHYAVRNAERDGTDLIRELCADVANLSMMLADEAHLLVYPGAPLNAKETGTVKPPRYSFGIPPRNGYP